MQTDSAPVKDQDWRQEIFERLHQLAEIALRKEAPGHSLQPTMLVNDAYLHLVRQRNVDLNHRAQVLAVAARHMRQLLVDHARRRNAEKRGGNDGRGFPLQICVEDRANTLDVIELHDALDALSKRNERAALTVELKYFGGLTGQEIAEHLDVSLKTVNNDWRFAKAWLYDALDENSDSLN